MDYKFEYSTISERDEIITSNSDKYLIEEQNIAEGNFLIFSDVMPRSQMFVELQKQTKNNTLQISALDDKSEILEGALVELVSLVIE